ncbi:MAG: hypothetical protein ACOC38_12245 [Promethearchaeia archaeon]
MSYEHYQMYKQGKVAKCENCGEWYLKSGGHRYSEDERTKDSIMLDKEVLEKWSKQLFAICMKGKEWSDTKYDISRYEKALSISGDIQEYWKKKMKASCLFLSRKLPHGLMN